MIELGKDITADELLEQLTFFDTWEEKYRYIIELGKSLPKPEDTAYTNENLVRGCQSQVWMTFHQLDGQYIFQADSDALIVKGLLAVILIAYNYKTAKEILDFDVDDYFSKLDLLSHISPVRGNGLKAMIQRIQSYVSQKPLNGAE